MGNRFKHIACALVALLVLVTGWTFAEVGPVAPERDIVVLFTSDVHCGVDQGFGYVGLKAIQEALEREGNDVLLVDDGDAIQGEAVGILTQGQAIIDMMNHMGYAAVQKAVDDAQAEGAQYVVLLAHLGNSAKSRPYTYADVIGHTRGIDAVLDGHSHDTDKVAVKNAEGREVPRQACGTKLEGIGWLRIAAVDGSVETGLYTWNNAVPAPRLLGLQNGMSDTVDDMMAWVNDQLNFVVAQCACELTINDPTARDDAGKPVRIIRRAETNLGDLIADAFRIRSGAEGEYRVRNVMIGGEPLALDRVYTLATQDFTLLNHGDGQTAFDGAKTVWQADVPDYGVVAAYLNEDLNGIVGEAYANPYGQGRIVAVG